MDILAYPFFQNALMALTIISVASAVIGTYIITRRMVFIAGGITHACFGGLGLGYFLGFSPVGMAAIFGVTSSLAAQWMARRGRVRSDSAIAVIWALGMALGILFIYLTPGYVPELNSFLFGSVLTVTRSDLLIFAIYTVVLLVFFLTFRNLILTTAFDSDFSQTRHLPVKFISVVMMIFVAIGIVLTIKLIGIMLLMSMISLPQMTAEQHTRSYSKLILWSIVLCLLSTVLGLFSAYWINVPASATIVLLQIIVYTLSSLLQKLKTKNHPSYKL